MSNSPTASKHHKNSVKPGVLAASQTRAHKVKVVAHYPLATAPSLSGGQQSTGQNLTNISLPRLPVSKHRTAMHRLSLLFLLVVLPLAANGDLQNVVCLGHGNNTANGNYEANIRRLAAILPAKTSSMPGRSANHEAGKFPDGLYAVSSCHNGTGSSSCRACVVLALQEAQRECPYHKEVVFFNGNCSLQLSALLSGPNIKALTFFRVNDPKERNIVTRNLSSAMVFQAIGFAWLFFLLLQEWRERKRGSMMRSSSLPSGDK